MKHSILGFCVLSLLVASCQNSPNDGIRPLGQYPGDPLQDYAPSLVNGGSDYRNLALGREAIHSSSFDYNLTGQLATDGIVTQQMPSILTMTTSSGQVPREWKERLFDENPVTQYTVEGEEIFLDLEVTNQSVPIDRITLTGTLAGVGSGTGPGRIQILGSHDGDDWETVWDIPASKAVSTRRASFSQGSQKQIQMAPSPVVFLYDYVAEEPQQEKQPQILASARLQERFGGTVNLEANLPAPVSYTRYKIVLGLEGATSWTFSRWDFYLGETLQRLLPSHMFQSAWMSATGGTESLTVDLGDKSSFDKVVLDWINPPLKGSLLSSNDGSEWKEVAAVDGSRELSLGRNVSGRYVRLDLESSQNGEPYVLSEMEVWGKGGVRLAKAREDEPTASRQSLNGGDWVLQRASLVADSGEKIASPDYAASGWLAATVPGTILTSYRNAHAIPDPNFGYNQFQISESYFLSDFWYRRTFSVKDASRISTLCLDGINWKAEIFLNGKPLGRLDGAFKKGLFDVTGKLQEGENALAVLIHKNDHPGIVKEQTSWSPDSNGGILGADNPTFHASIGWDWIPTIRGRNTGIWNDVYLAYNGPVTIQDPFVQALPLLPDTTKADISFEVVLKNHTAQSVSGVLEGRYGDTPASFSLPVTLDAREERLIHLDKNDFAQLQISNPRLWWPVGYGEPYLYDVDLKFLVDGSESDQIGFKSGVRKFTYEIETYTHSGGQPRSLDYTDHPQRLNMFINGRRFVGFGGNWGFAESNLNYRAREYDAAVAYHKDMNFTMIRNWVGMIGDEEFYEACDKYGVVIWQDFWLANPYDGPDPFDNDLFMDNAQDMVKRIRNHASIGIYVGRNEGYPPKALDDGLRSLVDEKHPGMFYISHSAADYVSGEGPYRALDEVEYFKSYGHDKFHSERGMPNVMTYETMLKTFGDDIEPFNAANHPNQVYGIHDYALGGAPGPSGEGSSAQSAESFNNIIRKMFREPSSAEEFASWAQWVNYNGYRAMFEGRSEHRRGLLLWMSHPTWPSMVWQTYDYYLNPTAAYFGCRKACEPLHIQYNPLRKDVEVVNYHALDQKGLKAEAVIYDETGRQAWQNAIGLDILEDQTVATMKVEVPSDITESYFLRLKLYNSSGDVLSENVYYLGRQEGHLTSLLDLEKVDLKVNSTSSVQDGYVVVTTTVENASSTPVPMLRLQAVNAKGEDIIAPAIYSDNYILLLGGEQRTITTRIALDDAYGSKVGIQLSALNVDKKVY